MWVQGEGRSSHFAGMIKGGCCGNLQARFYPFVFLLEFVTVNIPIAFFPSFPSSAPNPWFLLSCMTFGKENTDVPVIITLMIANECSVGTREELVLKHSGFGHEKQRVLYRHEKQISLWGNAVMGNSLKIVPKLS